MTLCVPYVYRVIGTFLFFALHTLVAQIKVNMLIFNF